eukprot:3595340-Rhodomonas_salina.1
MESRRSGNDAGGWGEFCGGEEGEAGRQAGREPAQRMTMRVAAGTRRCSGATNPQVFLPLFSAAQPRSMPALPPSSAALRSTENACFFR